MADNIKIVKKKLAEKIDGVITTILGIDRTIHCGNDTDTLFDDTLGLLFIL